MPEIEVLPRRTLGGCATRDALFIDE
jgi:hypothetical protein